ncbi:unnamed protein product [Rotaria sordida]|uniref:F-box domain-containing protein n=1 Tax=Rotaria sordida TaxID=392033 RepID=A0A815IG13_9BILA|nr:unnamed protein product [Rotaria sordida]
MNENKRKLSCENFSDEKSKKFCNSWISCFEDLSNDLFCEIFDYFNGYELFESFSNLNFRFEKILHSSSVLLKNRFYLFGNDGMMNTFKDYMLTNHHQIFSISIKFLLEKSSFFSSFLFDSSFDHLQSITFEDIQSNTIIPILNNLFFLPKLYSLTIKTSIIKEEMNEIYRLIFVLPKLKYSRICLSNNFHSLTYSMVEKNELSSIEYLVLDHYCSLNELEFLISFTPKLRRLTAHKIETKNFNAKVSSIELNNLKSLYLNVFQTTFNQLEIFLSKINSNLNLLTIAGSNDIAYLDAYRWEHLILNSFPQLEKFYLIYNDQLNDEENSPIFSGKQNQFSSSFWIQRKWLFEVEITYTDIQYTIRPFSKRWYHYPKCNIEHSTVTCLAFESIPEDTLSKQIEHVLIITQIYYLEILEKNISIFQMIQVINLLPDLTTLKIHSLSTDETSEFTVDEIFILCSMKETSQITKVFLEEINHMKELDFLFTLCPYMEYFRIEKMNFIDIQAFLRIFLKKINRFDNHHLRALCFEFSTADDLIIQNIQDMINSDKLLSHFTIERLRNLIYLQWK